MDEGKFNLIVMASLMGPTLTAIGTGIAMNEPSISFLGGLAGILVGLVSMSVNLVAYEAKPITNTLNKFKQYCLEKKLGKLETKQKENKAIHDMFEKEEM